MIAEALCAAEVAAMAVVAIVLALRLQGATPMYRAMLLAVPLCQAVGVGLYLAVVLSCGLAFSFVVMGIVVGVACVAANAVSFFTLNAAVKLDETNEKLRLLAEERAALEMQARQLEGQREEARHIYATAVCELDQAAAELALGAGGAAKADEHCRKSVELVDSTARHLCENRVVAALVAMKAQAAREAGIELSLELDVPQELPLSGVELCAVFANLFDNAINACAAVEEGQRFIRLTVSRRAAYLMVQMRNSYAEGTSASSHGEDAGSALPRHGWGLQIVRSVAVAHGGFLETSTAHGEHGPEFVADVALSLAPPKKTRGGSSQPPDAVSPCPVRPESPYTMPLADGSAC